MRGLGHPRRSSLYPWPRWGRVTPALWARVAAVPPRVPREGTFPGKQAPRSPEQRTLRWSHGLQSPSPGPSLCRRSKGSRRFWAGGNWPLPAHPFQGMRPHLARLQDEGAPWSHVCPSPDAGARTPEAMLLSWQRDLVSSVRTPVLPPPPPDPERGRGRGLSWQGRGGAGRLQTTLPAARPRVLTACHLDSSSRGSLRSRPPGSMLGPWWGDGARCRGHPGGAGASCLLRNPVQASHRPPSPVTFSASALGDIWGFLCSVLGTQPAGVNAPGVRAESLSAPGTM